jgi:hypothetical protein
MQKITQNCTWCKTTSCYDYSCCLLTLVSKVYICLQATLCPTVQHLQEPCGFVWLAALLLVRTRCRRASLHRNCLAVCKGGQLLSSCCSQCFHSLAHGSSSAYITCFLNI